MSFYPIEYSFNFFLLLIVALSQWIFGTSLSPLYRNMCMYANSCLQIYVHMYIALKFLTNLYILILIKNTYFYYSHKSWVMKIFCVYNIIIIHCSMQIIWFINKLHVNVIQWKSHFPFYGVIKVKRCCAAGDDDNGLCAHPLFLTIV